MEFSLTSVSPLASIYAHEGEVSLMLISISPSPFKHASPAPLFAARNMALGGIAGDETKKRERLRIETSSYPYRIQNVDECPLLAKYDHKLFTCQQRLGWPSLTKLSRALFLG